MGGGAITSATPLHVTPFSRGFGGEAITSSTSYLACVTCSRGGWVRGLVGSWSWGRGGARTSATFRYMLSRKKSHSYW